MVLRRLLRDMVSSLEDLASTSGDSLARDESEVHLTPERDPRQRLRDAIPEGSATCQEPSRTLICVQKTSRSKTACALAAPGVVIVPAVHAEP